MITIVRRLEIDAGHRLVNHESKCRNVHGHRYVFEVCCSSPALDPVGRVVDFGIVKAQVGAWLDDHLDHGFIYEIGDPVGITLQGMGQKVFEMVTPPTAENLSELVFNVAVTLLESNGLLVEWVRCHETPNCIAEYQPE